MRYKDIDMLAADSIDMINGMLEQHAEKIGEKDDEIEKLKKHIAALEDEVNDLSETIEKLEHEIKFGLDLDDICSNK